MTYQTLVPATRFIFTRNDIDEVHKEVAEMISNGYATNFVNELTNNEIIERTRSRHFEFFSPADIKDEVNALLESKCTPALIDEEVRKIWLANNTRLLPRKQIRSKDRDAARIVLYNRLREEIRIDVEIRRQKLFDLKYGILE